MRILLATLLFVFTSAVAYAQNNYQDVVYLKNGSIIRGMIIEQIPNKSIKIETADRNVFVYQMDEIEKLTKELYQGDRRSKSAHESTPSGYRGVVENGYQVGVGGSDRLKLNIVNGYQFNPYFSIGLGTGLRYYTWEDAALVPLFADFRVKVLDMKASPYFSLGAGYSFNISDGFTGEGFLLNPAIGVTFRTSARTALNIGLDYEMQRMEYLYPVYNGYYVGQQYFSSIYYNAGVENNGALGLTVGFSF